MSVTAGEHADWILHNGRIVTRGQDFAAALALRAGVVQATGSDAEVMRLRGPATRVTDLRGRTMIPGLIDSHTHLIRGGLNYNLELRWDGVPSLADAMRMLREQVRRTPPGQWVRVVGGFAEMQFAEKRLPTLDELNAAAPDTPVFILHLYDRALLNRAALRAVGYTRDTPQPAGGEIQRDKAGNPTGMLIARPNATGCSCAPPCCGGSPRCCRAPTTCGATASTASCDGSWPSVIARLAALGGGWRSLAASGSRSCCWPGASRRSRCWISRPRSCSP
ncbi:MAG: amidohydrolase family protein, partial [Burkholderiales bacterium]|nr:amidohydrolase family protein [Burkholderiales bacterium]